MPRMRLAFAIALALVCLESHARADYVSQSVPLVSDLGGPDTGMVLAEANSGATAVNGLQPGQVRLTFTGNPVPALLKLGPNFGFNQVVFNTDLAITPGQVTLPAGWTLSGPNLWPSAPNAKIWLAQNSPSPGNQISNPVVVVISGLGSQATLNHFLIGIPQPPSPPFVFLGDVSYWNSDGVAVVRDNMIGTIQSTPEPSTLVLGAVGLVAGIVVRQRRRLRSR